MNFKGLLYNTKRLNKWEMKVNIMDANRSCILRNIKESVNLVISVGSNEIYRIIEESETKRLISFNTGEVCIVKEEFPISSLERLEVTERILNELK
jgi:hypothetical protein